MYTRLNDNKREFTTGKTIKLIKDYTDLGLSVGQIVCNPSQELLQNEGWEEYIAPTPEPYIQTEATLEEKLIAVNKMLASQVVALDDEAALEVIALFPTWESMLGKSVITGERYYYNNKLYKVVQTHTVQSNWTPNSTAALFTEVSVEEFPEFVQPTGSHNAYKIGDQVTYNGVHYKSLIDNNVYSPEAYPQGWEVIN